MKQFTSRIKSANPAFSTIFLTVCLALIAFLLLIELPICTTGTVRYGQRVAQLLAGQTMATIEFLVTCNRGNYAFSNCKNCLAGLNSAIS